jgi:uncharacterized membrane protein YccC
MCQPHLHASLRKGWYGMIGTIVGAIAIVVLAGCFSQDRAPFLDGEDPCNLFGAGHGSLAGVSDAPCRRC